jgi:hypothetical protein
MGDVVKRTERERASLRWLALGLAMTAWLASVPRATNAAPPAPAPATSSSSRAPSPAPAASSGVPSLGGALTQIAARLAADIGAETKPAVVCPANLRSDEPAPRGAELVGKIAALVAGKLGSAVPRIEPISLASAQAAARRASWLVYVQTEIAHGQLRVTADVYPVAANMWERVREPVPAPTAHAHAAGRIDGEVRSYLAPVPLVGARIDRATLEDKDVVALACGDIDDDGTNEIVTLSRRRIAVGRARGGRFVTLRTALLRDLSGIAPTPLREPLGGIAIVPSRRGPPRLDVGISDRARGSRLDSDLKLVGAINGVPFATPYGDACMRFQGSTLATTIGKCAEADLGSPPFDVDGPLDAAAMVSFVTPDGFAHTVDAARNPRTGEVSIRAFGRTWSLPGAGAQIALADLDQDGQPEIITALDVLAKSTGDVDDALVITTLEANGSLLEKSRIPVSTGVRAVTACPPEGGSAPVVIATTGELWIVR